MSAIAPPLTDPLPTDFSHWLTDNNSLTQHLKQLCHQFTVEVLDEGLSCIDPTLAAALSFDLKPCDLWQREVLLRLDGIAWVYALTEIPQHILAQTTIDFTQLGTRPLGEVLFNTPEITRGQLTLTEHDHTSRAGQLAAQLGQTMTHPLQGRCRQFHLPMGAFTVHEVFLPVAENQINLLTSIALSHSAPEITT